jgi:hypothetical protein
MGKVKPAQRRAFPFEGSCPQQSLQVARESRALGAGPIPFVIQVRIRMVTEAPMKLSAGVSSMTVVW